MLRFEHLADHTYVASHLTPGSTIVDLGVSIGDFSIPLIERFGCRAIGLEPSAEYFDELPKVEGFEVEAVAITPDGGPATLHVHPKHCATIDGTLADDGAETVTVPGTTLADLLSRHNVTDVALLKVDIEGAELDMLLSASDELLLRQAQITIEFHDWIDITQRPSVRRVSDRLVALGFTRIDFSLNDTDVLFVNRSVIDFSLADHANALVLHKFIPGVKRLARRRLGLAPAASRA